MLTFRIALRELRGGVRDFRLFLACLIIGVAVIAGVRSVSHHVESGIRKESKTLMGGDVELTLSNVQAKSEGIDFLRRYGSVSATVNVRAMATFKDANVLVEVKGVDSHYPLLGQVQLASGKSLREVLSTQGILVEQALLDRLNANVGDRVTIGTTDFTILDILLKEPDHIQSPLSLGLRVMADMAVLKQHGFLEPTGLTRFHYNLLLDDAARLETFKKEVREQFPQAPWILKTSNDGNRGVQNFIDRLQLFMTLAGLSALLIGGIGIMNATETYLLRQSESIAVMKTLGASKRTVLRIYLLILFIIGLGGSVAGASLGTGIAALSLPYLTGVLPVFDTRLTFDAGAFLLAVGFGVLTVFTFSLVSLIRGLEVKPAVLFRGLDIGVTRLSWKQWLINGALALGLIAMLMLSSRDVVIAGGFIVSALCSFIIFALACMGVKALAKRIHLPTPWARLAMANLYRPRSHTLSIVLSMGIGLTVLIALLLVESNFQKEVDETMPKVAPSLFLIDIQPAQKDAFIAFVKAKPYVSDLSYQPMIRGRLSQIKGIASDKAQVDSGSRWAVESDRGITYTATAPANAKVVEGSWWPADYRGKPLVSLDRKLARGMNLTIGDTLTVNIMGQEITAEIASLRDVNYISFQINFSMIFSPGIIESLPSTFIATTRIEGNENEADLVRELAQNFPNVSSIRIKDSIEQIKALIGQIATALRLCALVTLLSGILVLASALAATLDKRLYDTVMLKVLGARKSAIIGMFLTEWLLLAVITSVIASVLGSVGALLILMKLDWIEFQVIPSVILGALALTIAFITVTGFAIHNRIFNTKASAILRNE